MVNLRDVPHRSDEDWNSFVERYRQYNDRQRRRGWLAFVLTVSGIVGLVVLRYAWGG